MLKELLQKFNLNEDELIAVYTYGSRVYQTFNPIRSDYDFIIVKRLTSSLKEELNIDNINITIYSSFSFQEELDNHEISVIETQFLPKDLILLEKEKFNWNLDLEKLRSSISAKVSNSWVKAKKKLIIERDFNLYIAKKSLFHVFRILHYGIQLASSNRIYDYTIANYYFEEIFKMKTIDWFDYYNRFKRDYNQLHSKFKKLAPKQVK